MSCCIFCKNKNYVIKVIGGVAKFSAKIKKVRICDSPHRDRFQKIRPERGIQAKSMSCCIFCKNQKFGHQNAMGGRIFCGEIKKSENLWKLTHRSVLKKLAQSAGSRQNQWAVAYLKIGRLNIDESITSVWEKSLASTKKKNEFGHVPIQVGSKIWFLFLILFLFLFLLLLLFMLLLLLRFLIMILFLPTLLSSIIGNNKSTTNTFWHKSKPASQSSNKQAPQWLQKQQASPAASQQQSKEATKQPHQQTHPE